MYNRKEIWFSLRLESSSKQSKANVLLQLPPFGRYFNEKVMCTTLFYSRLLKIKEWTGQSMSSLLRISDDRCRWVVIARSRCICRSTPNNAWVSRISVSLGYIQLHFPAYTGSRPSYVIFGKFVHVRL